MPGVDNLPYLLNTAAQSLVPATKALKRQLAALDKLDATPAGAAADFLYDLRALRQQLNQLTAPLDELLGPAIQRVEEHFVNTLSASEATGVQGLRSRVQVTTSAIPTVEDWDKLYAYILKNQAFDLLNRAVNREAVRERWDDKKQVPGVSVFHAKRVSCTKLNGKGKR